MAKKTDVLEIEDALTKLDDILTKLESGELSLAESVSIYEEGMNLAATCKKILEEAEQKIESLGAGIKPESTES